MKCEQCAQWIDATAECAKQLQLLYNDADIPQAMENNDADNCLYYESA